MKYRLKVKYTKRSWKLGINVYDTIEQANARVAELKRVGIAAKVIEDVVENY